MRRRLLHALALAGGSAAAALLLWQGGWLTRWEAPSWAWRATHFAARQPPSPHIKVVLLDQDSLDWGQQAMGLAWPWPREVYGALLDFCRRGGAAAVACDVLFTEPSSYGVADDQALGDALARNTRVIGALFLGDQSGASTTWPSHLAAPLPPPPRAAGFLPPAARRAAFPVAAVATNACLLANVGDDPDTDGVFRRATLLRRFDGRLVPSLGLAAFLKLRPTADPLRDVPLDRRGRMILRFKGGAGRHETFSALSVIASELALREGGRPAVDPATFSNACVFIGFSAPGLMDLRPTPVSRVYPGVEVHATVLDNLLGADMLRDARPLPLALLTLSLTLLSALAVLRARRARQSLVALACCLPLPALLAFAAYAWGVWWPLAASQLAVVFSLVGAVIVNYATEGRQRLFIQHAFRHYLGPEVIDQLVADPSRLTLGGEKRELTVFFSDIEHFSGFSERLDPTALTAFMNLYLSAMSAIIQEEGGYLDKYIGDAIVAFWNAPLAQPDHAARACRAALRCQQTLAARRAEFEGRVGAPVRTRIGLHSGEAVVGNLGSLERFNYTVLGDAVNLASRLEGANKQFGTYLMLSEATWRLAGDGFLGRELACLRVVGRQTPVRVHELVALAGAPRPAAWEDFAAGRRHFTAGDFAAAAACFAQLPNDPASQAYLRRCRTLPVRPPADWSGVWELSEK